MDDLKSYMRERVGTSSCSFDVHGDNAVGRSCVQHDAPRHLQDRVQTSCGVLRYDVLVCWYAGMTSCSSDTCSDHADNSS